MSLLKGIRMKRKEYLGVKYNIDINEIREESELEEMNFKNMVLFYLDELILIDNSVCIGAVLNASVARKMREHGMFKRKTRERYPGYNACLSQKGRDIIKNIIEDRKR